MIRYCAPPDKSGSSEGGGVGCYAVLGITAGCGRWLEISAPEQDARWAGWLLPARFVLVGLMLFGYREA